jgi:dipeptidyl aminopeptidase/acylaminoacyl peptidase
MTRYFIAALLIAAPLDAPLHAQDTTAGRGGRGAGGGRPVVITDTARARQLFVSKFPADLAGCGNNCDNQVKGAHRTDSAYEARAKGVMEFRKVTYKSRVDGLEIPAYLFAPLTKKASKHAALVWVHGGVHSNWGLSMWPS